MKFIFADDWALYYLDEAGYIWFYNTEMWPEWLDVPRDTPVSYMKRHVKNKTPRRVAKIYINAAHVNEQERQMTLEEFKAGMPKSRMPELEANL